MSGTEPLNAVRLLFCMLAANCLLDSMAYGAKRQVAYIVETPIIDPLTPPADVHIQRAQVVRTLLADRLGQLEIDQHRVIDVGTVQTSDAHEIVDSDVLLQVLITAGPGGLQIEAQIFDRTKQQWFPITQKIADGTDSKALAAEVTKEMIPQALVRILEFAQPSNRPVIFADCLVPSSDQVEASQQAGRVLSPLYADALQMSSELSRKFAVVNLLPSALPTYYAWWCVELPMPHRGHLRDDITTISGAIEAYRSSSKTAHRLQLELEIKTPDRRRLSPWISIEVGPHKTAQTLLLIRRTVERMTNGR
jgi:hypothetical protein